MYILKRSSAKFARTLVDLVQRSWQVGLQLEVAKRIVANARREELATEELAGRQLREGSEKKWPREEGSRRRSS